MAKNPSPSRDPNLSRRGFLKTSAGAALGGTLASGLPEKARAADRPRQNVIAEENAKPGSRDWQLTRVRLDKQAGFRAPGIEGDCSRQSGKAGGKAGVFGSTKKPARFEIEIFRTGYYGGCGARLMTKLGPFDGEPQTVPPVMGEERLRE